MKKNIFLLMRMLFIALFVTAISSCSDDDDETKLATVKVQITLPSGFSSGTLAGHTVILSSLGKENVTATTDATGLVTFSNMIPGIYSVSTSWNITAEEYREATGKNGQNSIYIIAGSLSEQTISTDTTMKLTTGVSAKSSLVISKVYYAGSLDNNGKRYIAGQYIEFFNNSDEEINIAGIYFGMVESNSTPAYLLGKTPNYIYLKQIFRFPNSGNTKIAPGASVVVTNSAIDHTVNGTLEPNLSNADFEAKDGRKMINNPAVPALELIYTAYSTLKSINFLTGGSSSIVLFKTDEDIATWEEVYADGRTKGVMQKKMPVKYVTDGVDILKNKTTGVVVENKRLYDYIDAGYTNIEAVTGKTGEVVYRKLETIKNGRNILIDTNNSSSDFTVSTKIAPKEYK